MTKWSLQSYMEFYASNKSKYIVESNISHF